MFFNMKSNHKSHHFSNRVHHGFDVLPNYLQYAYSEMMRAVLIQYHEQGLAVQQILAELHHSGLLGKLGEPLDLAVVIEHRNPLEMAHAMIILHEADLSREDRYMSREAVMGHSHPSHLAYAIRELNLMGLFSQENRQAIARQKNIGQVLDVLKMLDREGLLTEENKQTHFNAIIACSVIFCGFFSRSIWRRVTTQPLTADRFNKMIDIAKQYIDTPELGREILVRYVDDVLGIQKRHAEIRYTFNHQDINLTTCADDQPAISSLKYNKPKGP